MPTYIFTKFDKDRTKTLWLGRDIIYTNIFPKFDKTWWKLFDLESGNTVDVARPTKIDIY